MGYKYWPPKKGPAPTPGNLVKMVEAFLTRGKLVFLRDFDDRLTLAVARRNKDGILVAHRKWPNFRPLTLMDDGHVQSGTQSAIYVAHWIPARQTERVYAFMANYDTYAEKIRDD